MSTVKTLVTFTFLSPLPTASPARKGRKGKVIPAEVETVEAEKEKEEEMDAKKEEEAKVEKKGGRKVKSAPALVESTKEEEVTQMMILFTKWFRNGLMKGNLHYTITTMRLV